MAYADPARKRQWRAENRDKVQRASRRHHLKRKYGISLAQYDEMYAEQGGACAICGTSDTTPWAYFVVDHDHATGDVRGLLCHACNTVIGQAQDDPEILMSAARYVETR